MIRQRLQALQRSGLDRIPLKIDPTALLKPTTLSSPSPAAPTTPPPAKVTPPAPPPPSPRPLTPRPVVSAPQRPAPPSLPPVSSSLFGEEGFDSPPLTIDKRLHALEVLKAEVAACTRCAELASTRTQTVFGVGDPAARLMFIGEAPGADEDRLGFPFVGAAGQLLNDMITKGMGLKRQDVYIANVLKCRPPSNRDPAPAESVNCMGYLEQQTSIVRPAFICLLGRIAAQTLLDTTLPMGKLRGKWHRYKGIPTIATYHPAALLRNPAWKRDAWEDLQMLMRTMGLKIPGKKTD